VRIRAGAWPAFFAEPAHLFTDCVVDAGAVWPHTIAALSDRLGSAVEDRERITAIVDFLCVRRRERRRGVATAVARILASQGCGRVAALAHDAGVSARQLERAFRTDVGVSPKELSRLVRFQRALRLSAGAENAASWAGVAAACGFTDQSHLIRDFRQFAGETPATLAASAASVADYFLRR